MKRVLRILLIIPVLYIMAAPFWLNYNTGLVACGSMNVIIRDSADYRFVTGRQIRRLVSEENIKFAGVPAKDLPLDRIESLVRAVPEVRISEAYRTIDGTLHIAVDQRNPVLRLSASSGQEYYVDDEGYIIKKRGLYPPRVHIARAGFDLRDNQIAGRRLGHDLNDKKLTDLYALVNFIRDDQFWSALIDQINVSSRGEFDLITRAGGHKVQFGDISDMETKFNTLEAFYRQVTPETGWGRYSMISLKYSGQVVCKRR
jgi:cell division protein FtsQ